MTRKNSPPRELTVQPTRKTLRSRQSGFSDGRDDTQRAQDNGLTIFVYDLVLQGGSNLFARAFRGERIGRHVSKIIADVSVEADVEAMVSTAVKELGSLDVVSTQSFEEEPFSQVKSCRWWPMPEFSSSSPYSKVR